MPKRRLLLPLALAALLIAAFAPAGASAKSRYRVGISEQNASVFGAPLFQALKLKRVHYILSWDWYKDPSLAAETNGYLLAARAAHLEPFVTFTARRGCYNTAKRRYSHSKACRAPSTRAYKKAFTIFRKAYPWVKIFAAWNEANHQSQPTYKSPKRAAGYYNTLRKACRKCTIVAVDLLDSSNLPKYIAKFKHYAKKAPKIWGLHNYADVNRKRARGTQRMLRAARGQVWLTETGGQVNFPPTFKYNPTRAANRIKYMFKLADKYSKKRRGYHARITRIYPYQYSGTTTTANFQFDAGLVNPDGTPRPGYYVFKSKLRHKSR